MSAKAPVTTISALTLADYIFYISGPPLSGFSDRTKAIIREQNRDFIEFLLLTVDTAALLQLVNAISYGKIHEMSKLSDYVDNYVTLQAFFKKRKTGKKPKQAVVKM